MKLQYIGPDPAEAGIVPLPEGYPAQDHEEPNAEAAAAKLAFRFYRPGDLVDGQGSKPASGPAAYLEDKEPKPAPTVKE